MTKWYLLKSGMLINKHIWTMLEYTNLTKNAFRYEYLINKTKDRLSEILKRQTDKLFVACIEDIIMGVYTWM